MRGPVELTQLSAQDREVWSEGKRVVVAEDGSCRGDGNPRHDPRFPKTALSFDPEYRLEMEFVFYAAETTNTDVASEDGNRLYWRDTTGLQGSRLFTVNNFSPGLDRRRRGILAIPDHVSDRRRWPTSARRETIRFAADGETEIERPADSLPRTEFCRRLTDGIRGTRTARLPRPISVRTFCWVVTLLPVDLEDVE